MKRFFTILFLGAYIAASAYVIKTDLYGGRCNPKGHCSACKNCSGCKHCAKDGGSCSVCR